MFLSTTPAVRLALDSQWMAPARVVLKGVMAAFDAPNALAILRQVALIVMACAVPACVGMSYVVMAYAYLWPV